MRIVIFTLPLLVAACASIPDEGKITVLTTTRGQPLAGAECVVTTADRRLDLTTPATIAIGENSGDVQIVCSKSGYRTSELLMPRYDQLPPSAIGVGVGGTNGNVGMGLGISFPIGGSRNRPGQIIVNMNPL
jgi:hypothetical protein